MNTQPIIEQLCESGLTTLFSGEGALTNSKAIKGCVEHTYLILRNTAESRKKVILNVSQTITVEAVPNREEMLYIVTLVANVIDEEEVKRQQRAAQFDPRFGGTPGTPKLVS